VSLEGTGAEEARPRLFEPAISRRVIALTWAKAVGLLALARAAAAFEPTGLLLRNLAAVAALLFILLPENLFRRRGERWGDYGLPWWGAADARTWRAWGRGTLFGLGVCALAFPAFGLSFWGFADLLARLPSGAARLLGPYSTSPRLEPALPRGFALLALTQVLAVALPEEMFYRGFVQTAFARLGPARVRVLGAELGHGFFATQILFALGHLVSLEPWRVATFLPGLLFGWARERTGNLAAPVVIHALSNLFLAFLETSLLSAR